jgi:hypothetical protein
MLQTIEAEILPNGHVMFLEPLHLAHKVKAFVTILSDNFTNTATQNTPPNSGNALLSLLNTEPFTSPSNSNTHELDQTILANRNAWND